MPDVEPCPECSSEEILIQQAGMRKACVDHQVKQQMFRTLFCRSCGHNYDQVLFNKSCCGTRKC